MKGIVLAGGTGTRLHPLTHVISKQLLPVYNKPMIYYPISVQFLAGIREILIISTPHDLPLFERLLGDGSQWGMSFSYAVQEEPNGIAEAFIIGEKFIDNQPVCLVLGDNILWGAHVRGMLRDAAQKHKGATLFGYKVKDPERYGVVELDQEGIPTNIIEKPVNPKSNVAVTGLYFYDERVSEIAKTLKPSPRGELEITDINSFYVNEKSASVNLLRRGYACFDTGTFDSLLHAGQFVQAIEERQGTLIASLDEIALNNKWIDLDQFTHLAKQISKNPYGQALLQIAKERAENKESLHAG